MTKLNQLYRTEHDSRRHQLCRHLRNFWHYLEPKRLLSHSQQPATGPNMEAGDSTPHQLNLSLFSTHLLLRLPSSPFTYEFHGMSRMYSCFLRVCYMSCASLHPWRHRCNYTSWRGRVMKILLMRFSPPSRHVILLKKQIFSSESSSRTTWAYVPT
jgi:hypothetical protein